MTDAIDQLSAEFTAQTAIPVQSHTAATSTNARLVQNGAPGHIFISAHPKWIKHLTQQGIISQRDTHPFATTRLAVIQNKPQHSDTKNATLHLSTEYAFADLPHTQGLIAIATPDHVPLGIYAKQALEHTGLWQNLSHRLVPMQNARAVLASVASGATPYGFAYASDVKRFSHQVAFYVTIPEESHTAILYQVAAIFENEHPMKSAYMTFLLGPVARSILEQNGFQRVFPR